MNVRWIRTAVVVLAVAGIQACATRPPAVPVEHAWRLPWGAVDPATGLAVGIDAAIQRQGAGQLPPDSDGNGKPNYVVLVISGGGAKGAFGAGLLKGWTATGERPEFTLVTGVSTGALMATWAFLGADYDPELERFYTRTTDEQIFHSRFLLAALFGDALLDTAPLRETIAAAVDQPLLDAVARAYRKGRRLYVASTDLDNNRLVVWDLGGIAASGRPDRLARYRDALLASASIPVGFPPVYFPIDIDGERYSQMHVDGGAIANLFLTDFILDRQRELAPPDLDRDAVDVDLYLLMNSQLTPQPPTRAVGPSMISISMASSWSTSWSAQSDRLARAHGLARGMGAGLHLAGIPDDYDGELPLASFDPVAMSRLFHFAEQWMRSGGVWLDAPPGLSSREQP